MKKFERDEEKNQINIAKPKIDFTDIIELFKHPLLHVEDTRVDYGERRIIGFGYFMKKQSKTNWKAIDALTDEDIDYSDIPEVTANMFKNMTVLLPDDTKKINIRLKNNTIEFFKRTSKHYQTMINAVLDAYVEAQQKKYMKLKGSKQD